jgi:nucleotide-binding universal stress UspA family protein
MTTRLILPGVRDTRDITHIQRALEVVPGVQSVAINREEEIAIVDHDGADLQQLRRAAQGVGLRADVTEAETVTSASPAVRTKTILAPVDFSSVTDHVVGEAAALARALGARVVLVHVTEPTTGVVDYAAIVVAIAQVNEAAVKHAVERLGQIEQELKDDGVAAASVHLTGSPIPEIIEQAEKLPADYIVIGSHGHTAFYDLLVGGTAHGVLKRAKCPVVIVPPPPKRND